LSRSGQPILCKSVELANRCGKPLLSLGEGLNAKPRSPDFFEFNAPDGQHVVEICFDGKGKCIGCVYATTMVRSVHASAAASPAAKIPTNLVNKSFRCDRFLLLNILEAWEQEWIKKWPKPERKDLLQWQESGGGSMKGMIEAAKLFVQKKIAEGCPYSPRAIFCIHIHTQNSRIQKECREACDEAVGDPLRLLWQPYIDHLEVSLREVPPVCRIVYRSVSVKSRQCPPCVAEYLDTYIRDKGARIIWDSFVSGTSDPIMAHSLLRKFRDDGDSDEDQHVNILYKVLQSRAVPVSEVSSFPEQQEVIFLQGSTFIVKGFYRLTGIMLFQGAPVTGSEWDASVGEHIRQDPLSLEEARVERNLLVVIEQVQT